MLSRCMISAALVVTGCSFESDSNNGPDAEPVGVQGQVVDFQTGAAVDTASKVTISGIEPAPDVSLTGATFTISGIPQSSVFEILVAAPSHRSTYSQVVVTTSGVSGIKAPVAGDTFITNLAAAFAVSPSATRGTLLLHLLDAAGKPRAGVAATSFAISGANGPHFLDANLMALLGATSSSTSGWAVFFDVPVGLAAIAQTGSAPVTIDIALSPVAAAAVTIVDAKVTDGAPALPANVSFTNQIMPIFQVRGCVACHSGNGIGKDLGGLTLDGSANHVYSELVLEKPNTRVRVAAPETSLVLTMPSREDPPDAHPNVTFTGPRDPDYLKLLVWIREGAKQN